MNELRIAALLILLICMLSSDRTIAFCLTALGASNDALIGCSDVIEEFGRLKKLYLKKALQTHPDKGGDVNEFRDLQSAWESVRSVFENGSVHPSGFSFYFKAEGGQVRSRLLRIVIYR